MKTHRLAFALAVCLTGACTPASQSTTEGTTGSGGASGGSTGDKGTGGTAESGTGGTSGGSGGAGASATGGSETGNGSGGSGGSASGTGGSASAGTGGSGTSGGSGGSSGSDAGTQPGPDGSAPGPDAPAAGGGGCGSAKFCDGFESQTVGGAPTGMFKIERAVTVDGTKGFKSQKSLLVKGGGFIVFTDIAAMLPSNDLHGRAMVWMNMTPGAAHFDTIMASGQGGTYILGGMYGKFMSVYHPGDCSVDSKTPFPTGRWACLQWEFKGAKDGTHLHKMMLDGQVVDNGIQDGNQGFCVQGGAKRDWKAPTFNQLKIGHVQYGGTGGVQLWIDDVAFGEAAIPCPALE